MVKTSGILISATLMLIGCTVFNSVQHYRLDPGFTSYFRYGNGSTWTYTLASDTQVKETVQMNGFQQGKMNWDGFDQEFFSYELITDNGSKELVRAVATEGQTARWALLIWDTSYRQAAEMYYTTAGFAGVSGQMDTLNFYSQYIAGDRNYTDVVELKLKNKRYYKALYFARNVGIIRKDQSNGKTWFLKNASLK
ncbi:MAG: hypothetical protein JNL57_09895 [Bacteroidetes bacterium]|nr:hypothetical protein [Bacteroidota bacterium]